MADSASPKTAALRLPRSVRDFLATEMAGGVVLVAAAAVALTWANSPWRSSYDELWHTSVTLKVGGVGVSEDLRHFVNDALMALFFFVVGLEIKRELVAGELRYWRTAAFPAVAALGGMVVPAALFAVVNIGAPGSRGWGIPMATDIAFALGVLALLGDRVPSVLKLFLLTLAIVDDIGAIVIIAVFYSGGLDLRALALAAGLIAVVLAFRRAKVYWTPAYVVVGVGLWLAVYESGIHATIAGVVLGLLTPARPLLATEVARGWAADLAEDPSHAEMRAMRAAATSTLSVAERLAHDLHPLTSFVIVPLFALANAGVRISGDAMDAPGAGRVAAGIVLGLVVGKLVGISAASWLAVRLGLSSLPSGLSWRQLVGGAMVAGIGFTVSLFIAELAFSGSPLEPAAKLAILVASVMASLLGYVLLRRASTVPVPEPVPQPVRHR